MFHLLGRVEEADSIWPRRGDKWSNYIDDKFEPLFLEEIDWEKTNLDKATVESECENVSDDSRI